MESSPLSLGVPSPNLSHPERGPTHRPSQPRLPSLFDSSRDHTSSPAPSLHGHNQALGRPYSHALASCSSTPLVSSGATSSIKPRSLPSLRSLNILPTPSRGFAESAIRPGSRERSGSQLSNLSISSSTVSMITTSDDERPGSRRGMSRGASADSSSSSSGQYVTTHREGQYNQAQPIVIRSEIQRRQLYQALPPPSAWSFDSEMIDGSFRPGSSTSACSSLTSATSVSTNTCSTASMSTSDGSPARAGDYSRSKRRWIPTASSLSSSTSSSSPMSRMQGLSQDSYERYGGNSAILPPLMMHSARPYTSSGLTTLPVSPPSPRGVLTAGANWNVSSSYSVSTRGTAPLRVPELRLPPPPRNVSMTSRDSKTNHGESLDPDRDSREGLSPPAEATTPTSSTSPYPGPYRSSESGTSSHRSLTPLARAGHSREEATYTTHPFNHLPSQYHAAQPETSQMPLGFLPPPHQSRYYASPSIQGIGRSRSLSHASSSERLAERSYHGIHPAHSGLITSQHIQFNDQDALRERYFASSSSSTLPLASAPLSTRKHSLYDDGPCKAEHDSAKKHHQYEEDFWAQRRGQTFDARLSSSPHLDAVQSTTTPASKSSPGPSRLQRASSDATEADRPFACPGCSRRFARRYDRNRHARKHTGEKPYVCAASTCGEMFVRPDALQRHYRANSSCAAYKSVND